MRRRGRGQLVTHHLEGVQWSVLETYPSIIKRFIRRRSGVYALFRRDRLYYVGLAKNLIGRIKNHLKDRHHGAWDRFSLYVTVADEHMKELESLLLRIATPPGNKQGGRFAASRNLMHELNSEMADEDAARRARMLGGNIARKMRRSRGAKTKGAEVLAGLVDRTTPLFARHGGTRFHGALLKSGEIRFNGRRYQSPSAAGRAALGRGVNGWDFWRYRDSRRVVQRLSKLKR